MSRNDDISIYCMNYFIDSWNRGVDMVIWNWGPWRQVEIISRAVSNITANGLGFQHSGGLGVSHEDLYWLP